MENSGARRVIPIILVLIIIAIAIAAIVSFAQNFFGGGSSEEVNQGQRSLLNTAEDRSVRMTVRGPIVANEKFVSYTITVQSTGRNMTTYLGYLDKQFAVSSLDNNVPAYEQFVYALDRAKMMNAPEQSGDANDNRGICATGRMFTFETLRGTTVIKSLWTTTCNNARGTLGTASGPLENLFLKQIPSSSTMVSNVITAAQKVQ